MTDGSEGIDPEALRRRLPDGWAVVEDAGSVHGHTETPDPEDAASGVDATTRFTIRLAEGSLWRASWRPPDSHSHGALPVADQVTGNKERCVEWVLERIAHANEERLDASPSVSPAEISGSRPLERESAEMVCEWMDEAPREELSGFLTTVAPERFFDEDGEPQEVFLSELGGWRADEVFTALWEGRSIADAGNVDAFEAALGRAERWFGEHVVERVERD